ncbi:MAG TPA: polysaccharide biosynthesis tyrosine autokinase, partial [Chloroflexi bacterium]|nr:polysaccharide biosynthesis tyrosine autokinase [Chloroflexota bacterium]
LASNPLSDPYSVSNVRTIESVAEVFAAKIKFPRFLQEVKEQLGLPMDVRIEDMITVQQIGSTQLIRISVENDDPALAQALANTVVQVLIEQEISQQQASFQAGLTELETQINALEANIAATQVEIATLGDPGDALSEFVRLERTRLESQLTRDQTRLVVLLSSAEEFRLAMARYTDTITVYAPAELPTSPVASRTLQNTLLGAATGLMIGVGVAFLLEYLDDTIKSPQDVRQILPVGVLGALPRMEQRETNGQTALVVTAHPLHPIAEAFRSLRTSIQFSGVDTPTRTLLVTSPLPTDGKTFTAANLAVVMAQGGQSVIALDADLRHSTLHRAFRLPKEPGLTTALLSPDRWEQALQPTEVEGLRIVGAGPRPPNPAELLASHRFREFLSWLREEADVVIIDSPPVLAVTDAAVLSTLADGVMLILDCGETRQPAAVQAAERLLSVGGNLLGVVLNRLSSKGDGYYYYSYYYSQEDGAGQSASAPSRIARLLKLNGRRRGRDMRRRRKKPSAAERTP